LNEPATHILHGVPTGATYKEFSAVPEKFYGDHQLEAAIHTQLKRRTTRIKESLQESATVINHLARCAFIRLLEHLISEESACAYQSKK
jgi:transcriptional regulator of heat shock response